MIREMGGKWLYSFCFMGIPRFIQNDMHYSSVIPIKLFLQAQAVQLYNSTDTATLFYQRDKIILDNLLTTVYAFHVAYWTARQTTKNL